MFDKFLKEEKGQGSIEYIILAGAIIIAAVIIFTFYTKMTKEAGTRANQSLICSKYLNQSTCEGASDADCTWNAEYRACLAE